MKNAKDRLQQMKKEMSEEKSFWPQILVALVMTFAAYKVAADEMKTNVLKTHHMENSKGGDIFVVIQRVENVMGTPYQVELRGSCSNKKYENAKKAPLLHVENFCDVKLSSPKLEGESLTFLTREVDAEKFNKATNVATPEQLIKLKPTCLESSKQVSWGIKNFCN